MGVLIGGNQQIGLEVNYERTNDMVTSRDQNAGQNQSKETGNTFFKAWNSSDIWEQPLRGAFKF